MKHLYIQDDSVMSVQEEETLSDDDCQMVYDGELDIVRFNVKTSQFERAVIGKTTEEDEDEEYEEYEITNWRPIE